MKHHDVAVLGLGSIGLRHARNLLELGCRVSGFDPDPARRAMLAEAGGTALEKREAAFAHGAVVIATPSAHHAADLADAVDAGCHVFIEKPLAHSAEGLDALIARAATRGLTVFAGFMLRYHPAVERLRTLIDEGVIDRIVTLRAVCGSWLPAWRPGQDYRKGYAADPRTGGVILDIVHEIDLACHLAGPATVAACVARRSGLLEMEAEDIADIVLAHDGGITSNLHLDYLARPPVRCGAVTGEGGTLAWDLNARTLLWSDATGAVRESAAYPGAWNDDYIAQMRHFLACLDGETIPRCDGAEALAVLQTALAARSMAGLPS